MDNPTIPNPLADALLIEFESVAMTGRPVPPLWHVLGNLRHGENVWCLGPIDGDLLNNDDSNIYNIDVEPLSDSLLEGPFRVVLSHGSRKSGNVNPCANLADVVTECRRLWDQEFGNR
jgi:hypothetical protein